MRARAEQDGSDLGAGGLRDPRALALVALQLGALVALVALPAEPSFTDAAALHAVGAGLVLLGVGVMAWAALELGRSLTPLPGPRATAALITSGPFAIARHPIYVGLALAVLGSSLWSGGLPQLAVAIGLGALLIVKSRYEESLLTARFPDYGVYAARVPAFGVRLPRR